MNNDNIDKNEAENSPSIKDLFEGYFAKWNIELPNENLNNRLSGKITQAGWFIQFCFGKENDLEYLDFYASHRMTNDRHERIYEDGKMIELPSYRSFYISNDDGSDKKAYEEYNENVTKLLFEKGFNNFTINMTINSGILDE